MHDDYTRPETAIRAGWRDRWYRIIFQTDTFAGHLFDVILLLAIVISVTAVCLETVESWQSRFGVAFYALEWFFTLLFTAEYGLRLVTVRRPLAYVFSFYGIIDLLSFLPTYVGLLFNGSRSFAVIRLFRLLRIFRIMKLIRLTAESEELGRAIWRVRGKVIVFITVVLVIVTVSGALMYEIEKFGDPNKSQFTSIPQSVYWAIVTMTTVGYGDIVPHTSLGKFVSAILIVIGYSLIIVPTGFVSAEIIKQSQSAQQLTRTCPHCLSEGHDRDAKYCDQCGRPLAAPVI